MSDPLDAAVGHPGDRRRILAWSLWDWGSAAFNAVITTFVFSVYLTDAVGKDLPGRISAESWLGWALGLGSLIIFVVAPGLGREADAHGRRKRTLIVLTLAVVALTATLYAVKDDYHYLWFGLVVLAVATVLFELASVPYFSMLRQVSTPDNVGRVSGLGWAFGYLGGIVLLLVCYFGFVAGDGDTRGFLGISTEDGFNIRLIALLSAAWFLVFALPLFFSVPELPASGAASAREPLRAVYAAIWRDVKTMWHEDRNTLKFLLASAFFRDGLAGVFTFGAIIAVKAYGIGADDVLLFGVAANVIAAAGAILAGRVDDVLGPRFVIVVSLSSMLVAGTILLFVSGPLMFWIFGLALCAFVGPAQSASRTYLTRITDVGKEGQNFGLYAMTGRAVSFLAPTLFGAAVAIGGATRWGIIGIMIVLAIGLVLLLRVPAQIEDRARAVVS